MKKLLKNLILPALIVCSGHYSMAQVHRCFTTEHETRLQQLHPKRNEQRRMFDQKVNDFVSRYVNNKTTMPGGINIPVVVHVVYKNAAQNISNAQIQSQITVLNEDFNHLNADTANTPSVFQSIAGNAGINFCLAQIDPNGNATTGIERFQTTVNSFIDDDAVKAGATGGLDAWDPSQYFNIWVCNLGGGLLGYAEFPTSTLSNTYGVVIGYTCFGNTGTVQGPYNLGRTATHEVGHCFNLFHIWGDDGGACTGSDQCADTPNQASENYGCPAFPQVTCSNGPNGDMWMNYMDYTDDACMNMFTNGQVARMMAVMNNGPYADLQFSSACGTASLYALDAKMVSVDSPNGNICNGNFAPQITIRNLGTDTLTSLTINYQVDNGTMQTYNWSGSLASLAYASVTLPNISAGAGAHTLNASCSLPNSNPDMNTTNDAASSSFSVVGIGQPVPYAEGFEGSFPPTGSVLSNPDASYTWEQNTTAAHTGTHSILMNNFDYSSNGEIDDFILPNLDLTSVSAPKLSFWVAYRLYTNPTANPNFSDTLEVLVSTDCGTTFTSVYKKFGTALVTTAAPYFTTNAFVPTAAQWRRDSVDLAPYANGTNVVVIFRSITDYENYLFLDDINIDGTTGLQEAGFPGTIQLYPNPASNWLNIDLNKIPSSQTVRCKLYDVTGRLLTQEQTFTGGEVAMIQIENLSNGLYIAELSANGKQQRKQFVVNK